MSLFVENSIPNLVDKIKKNELKIDDVYDEVVFKSRQNEKYNIWASFSPEILKESFHKQKERYSNRENECYAPIRNPYNLYGIPIGVKDIMNTIDYPTQMGSVIWKDFEAGNDARIVKKLRYDGGIVAGKTVTAEFAVHALNETLNPYDTTRTPGTSSSGSAVSVALGVLPVALATQTAGSIIRPSSFCGVYGFMPSFGRIPRTGILKTTDSLDTVGFITSNIGNLKVMLQSLSVNGPDYPFVYKASKCINRRKAADRKWKIGFVKTYTWDEAENYVKDSISSFVELLRKDEGIEVEQIDINNIIKDAHSVHSIIYDKSLSYYFANEHHDRSHVSDVMNALIEHGEKILPQELFDALDCQEQMCEEADDFMKNYDAIVSISTASIAPKRGVFEKRDPSLIWTLLHLPSINLPVFREGTTGLPFGVQVSSRRFNDELLIDFVEYLAKKELIPEHIKEIDL